MGRFRHRLFFVLTCASLAACSGESQPGVVDASSSTDAISVDSDASGAACSDSEAAVFETRLQTTLEGLTTDVDFSVSFENAHGRRFSYSRGASTMQTSYKSASTSKWVTAAIILRAVELNLVVEGKTFSLDSLASEWIVDWPIGNLEIADIRLRDLLSFTSGLTETPLCISIGTILSFEDCVARIATNNSSNGKVPGAEFYYGGNHMQAAGLMTMVALGQSSWQGVFDAFKQETGLFATSAYYLPAAASGPRLV